MSFSGKSSIFTWSVSDCKYKKLYRLTIVEEQQCGYKARELRVLIWLIADRSSQPTKPRLPSCHVFSSLLTTVLSSTFRLLCLGTAQTSPRVSQGTPEFPLPTADDPVHHGSITAPHFLVATRFLAWMPWLQIQFEDREGSSCEGIAGLVEESDTRYRLASRHAASTRRFKRPRTADATRARALRTTGARWRGTAQACIADGPGQCSMRGVRARMPSHGAYYLSATSLGGKVPCVRTVCSAEPAGARAGEPQYLLSAQIPAQSSQKRAQHEFIAPSDGSPNSAHYVSAPSRVWQTEAHKLDAVDDDELASTGIAGERVSTHYRKACSAHASWPTLFLFFHLFIPVFPPIGFLPPG
ncbi:hypothetical protein C8R47DRAFT_1084145 [Mycena vitilis]|nr:hypothetical protein C8R47DRAFT_1084145 [Mycena vitilis]